MTFHHWTIILLLAFVVACTERRFVHPDYILADAHSSGSRVAVEESGDRVVSAGLDGGLALWDVRNGRLLRRWKGHRGTVNGLYFLPGDELLVSGGWDGVVAIWDLRGRAWSQRHTGVPVTALALQRQPLAIWSGHEDGSLRRWSPALELQEEQRLPGRDRVTALAWRSGRLAAADHAGNLWLFDDSDERKPRHLARLPAYLRTLAFDDQGKRLFGGSWFRLYR